MAFHGKVALITGGASGMGQAMALRLARAGAQVAVVDLNAEALEATARQAGGIRAYPCDVSSSEQLQSVVERVRAELGPIDRLASAAGIMPARSIVDMPAERFAQVMRVNYEGTVNVVKSVLPQMLERRSGEIILFGSLAGVIFSKNFAAYGASKAAINAFGEVLAQELRNSGIRVLTVRPAAVNTPLISQATGEGGLTGLRKQARSGRMASPEQIIDAVEAGLDKGLDVVYPNAEARIGQWLRRLSPALTWKIANASQGG
ncbi:MAG: SDR family NAD(P)-dependent oxidoreductase [Gammaproteobacteria bacterium]